MPMLLNGVAPAVRPVRVPAAACVCRSCSSKSTMTPTPRRTLLLAAAAGAALSSVASAQTGPELLIKPFPKDQQIEATASGTYIPDGSTDHLAPGGDEFDIDVWQLDVQGRMRLQLDPIVPARAEPRFGFDVTFMDLDTDDPTLPTQLVDTSVAFGMGVLEEHGWIGGITVGIGYAGAGAFDDGNAWYGKADFAIGRTIDETSEIGFVLDYDGNRSFMPDVPLPGFQYRKRLDPKLLLAVGFPFTSVEWKPIDELQLRLTWTIPDAFNADVTYEISKTLGLFGAYTSRTEAFHWDEIDNSRDRLIFEQRRAEAGVKWSPVEELHVVVAGGYAFGQEFSVGWDSRETDLVTDLSDEPYIRVGLEWRY